MLRIIFGFLLAPMPILLPFVWVVLAMPYGTLLPARLLAIAAFIYGPALLFGVPTHLLLRRFGKRRLWHYLAAAMALPVLVTLVVFAMEITEMDNDSSVGGTAAIVGGILAVAAALTALLFWLIAIWRSPEPGQIARTKLSTVFD